MEKIEINTPEPEKVLPILRDAIERQNRMLSQSLARTEERIQQLAIQLRVDADLLMAGEVPHPRRARIWIYSSWKVRLRSAVTCESS